ncbi:tRNA lysidine(34) synthetase TilS, partial [bacterium]|nr:tRNA lysidine(34) synthetase TilS [bacterium]
MNLFSEFEKRCEVFNIRNEGITYILAYSGGTDSTALLHLTEKLCKCKGSNQFIVAHYNHTLRPEAEQEIKLIQSLCADNELQLVIGKGDVASEALKLKKSEHDMGRKMRYDFLAECALGVDVKPSDNLPSQTENVILTAHHQDDQIETVLMRLISGAGVDGMAG